jgi:hypothetical protein
MQQYHGTMRLPCSLKALCTRSWCFTPVSGRSLRRLRGTFSCGTPWNQLTILVTRKRVLLSSQEPPKQSSPPSQVHLSHRASLSHHERTIVHPLPHVFPETILLLLSQLRGSFSQSASPGTAVTSPWPSLLWWAGASSLLWLYPDDGQGRTLSLKEGSIVFGPLY